MGQRYLIDTNAIIDYLAGLMPPAGLTFMDAVFDSGDIIISVITQIEVLGFQAPESYLLKCQSLLEIAEIIPLADTAIIKQAIQVRRYAKIKLPDAVIAATALVHGLTIVSKNGKDFSRVDGLLYTNPYTL